MPLTIIQDAKQEKQKALSLTQQRRVALEAKYERAWLVDPEQFNPANSLTEMQRMNQTWQKLESLLSPEMRVVDLACGWGLLTEKLLEAGCKVDAVDVASNALKRLPHHPRLRTFNQAVPRTTLDDYAYDVVLALDVLTELNCDDYRLFMSEVQRLMNRKGIALISTPLDHRTEDPLHVFLNLLQKEFVVKTMNLSYHKYPNFGREWLMEGLEKVTKFLFPETGITHVMVVVEKKELKF